MALYNADNLNTDKIGALDTLFTAAAVDPFLTSGSAGNKLTLSASMSDYKFLVVRCRFYGNRPPAFFPIWESGPRAMTFTNIGDAVGNKIITFGEMNLQRNSATEIEIISGGVITWNGSSGSDSVRAENDPEMYVASIQGFMKVV